jgi:hypothetical protein
MPEGETDRATRTWRKLVWPIPVQCLCPGQGPSLGKFLAEAAGVGLRVAGNFPKTWVVHRDHMGSGAPALKCLARHLCRGVISGRKYHRRPKWRVTFRYRASAMGTMRKRTLKDEAFLPAAPQACPAQWVQATARVWISARQCETNPYAGSVDSRRDPQTAAALSRPVFVCRTATG